MSFFKKNFGLFFVLLLSFWALKPFFNPGFFPMHDDTQVVRVYEMAKALKEGQFPVRWVADLGYGFGYPIFNFYGPLPYYFGAIFVLLGLDALIATKLMFIAGILLSGIFMYLLGKEFWGEWGGVMSGLFYIYAPYHAVQIYVRGAVGEFWALVFLPLFFYGLWKSIKEKRFGWVVIGCLGFTGVILSHNITAMMLPLFLTGVLIVIFIYAYKSKKLSIIHYPLSIIVLGLTLSAFFWLPALWEMNLTKVFAQIGGGADFRDHFVYLDQLWAGPWGFGGSGPGRLDGMSFMIGKLHILVVIIAFLIAIFNWNKEKFKSKIIILSTFYFLLSTFMVLEISKPIWEAVPSLAFVQYPWRFLVFVIFPASFIAGSIIFWIKNRNLKLLFVSCLLLVVIFLNSKYFKPQIYLNLSAADYINEENIKWKTSKISDEYLPRDFATPKIEKEIVKEKFVPSYGVILEQVKILSSHYEFKTKSQTEGEILIKTAYFPGWKVFLDGKEISVKIQEGQILIPILAGEHTVRVIFTNTLVRTLANLISLIVGLVLIGGFVYEWKKEN